MIKVSTFSGDDSLRLLGTRLGPFRRELVVMSVTPDLSEDVLQRLSAEAKRRGVALSDVVADLAAQRLPADQPRRRRLAFVGAGASASGTTHRIDQLLDEGFGRD